MAKLRSFERVNEAFASMDAGRCPRARLLKRVIAESETNVAALFPSEEEEARQAFIAAGMAYCTARCGGCSLTRERLPRA